MSRPLIGLTTTLRQDSPGIMTAGMRQTYIQAILDAGGLPVLIPVGPQDVLRATLERLDGLLLPGGGDIIPSRYDEQPQAQLRDPKPERDDLEITLCMWALEDGTPVLGICRGIQVMNVAAGGTLYQDIRSQYETQLTHDSTEYNPCPPRDHIAHDALVEPGTRLATLVGAEPLLVNSWHHQAVKDLGQGLIVTARSADGLIEAVEVPGHPFAVGVQFHPEDLYTADARLQRLFAGFVEAAGR